MKWGRMSLVFIATHSKLASGCASSKFRKLACSLESMKTLHERVTRAITKSGHTASSAVKKLDVSPEAVLQWMSVATKNIRPTNLFALIAGLEWPPKTQLK